MALITTIIPIPPMNFRDARYSREFRDLGMLGSLAMVGIIGTQDEGDGPSFAKKDKACRWGQALGRLFYVGDGD